MTKELKVSLLILSIGAIGLVVYWFLPIKQFTMSEKKAALANERIILPNANAEILQLPEILSYQRDVQNILNSGQCVLPLPDNELKGEAKKVQNILLNNLEFLADCKFDNKIVHNDMMRILPAIISVLDPTSQKTCKLNQCYTAEKYNFVTNTTTRAIVDSDDNKMLSVKRFANMQPDISLRLTRIAQAIAINSHEVKSELNSTPTKLDISMANVRGALQESPCENSKHLCVAPTFSDHEKEQALWAVVDLTELKLVAAKWAGLGKTTTPACISERSLQNRLIMEKYCQKETYIKKNKWEMVYRLTGSDGLEIREVSFKGTPILTSAKTVDWHVAYKQKGAANIDTSMDTIIAGRRVEYSVDDNNNYLFGYNDAMGCPMFSTSVVLPFNAPQIEDLLDGSGFSITQDFRNPKWPMACNYRYENRYEFYDDGSFRVLAINKGRGCGDDAIYRPLMRIDMAIAEEENFYENNGEWQLWETEKSKRVTATDNIYPFKITARNNASNGFYIEPNYGQFNDNSRGDNATLFTTRYNEKEGNQDLLTLGSCCDLSRDGVERYTEDKEKISGENIVLWYVPRIQNDAGKGHEYCWADTVVATNGNLEVKVWPCIVGPKFIPISL